MVSAAPAGARRVPAGARAGAAGAGRARRWRPSTAPLGRGDAARPSAGDAVAHLLSRAGGARRSCAFTPRRRRARWPRRPSGAVRPPDEAQIALRFPRAAGTRRAPHRRDVHARQRRAGGHAAYTSPRCSGCSCPTPPARQAGNLTVWPGSHLTLDRRTSAGTGSPRSSAGFPPVPLARPRAAAGPGGRRGAGPLRAGPRGRRRTWGLTSATRSSSACTTGHEPGRNPPARPSCGPQWEGDARHADGGRVPAEMRYLRAMRVVVVAAVLLAACMHRPPAPPPPVAGPRRRVSRRRGRWPSCTPISGPPTRGGRAWSTRPSCCATGASRPWANVAGAAGRGGRSTPAGAW